MGKRAYEVNTSLGSGHVVTASSEAGYILFSDASPTFNLVFIEREFKIYSEGRIFRRLKTPISTMDISTIFQVFTNF